MQTYILVPASYVHEIVIRNIQTKQNYVGYITLTCIRMSLIFCKTNANLTWFV